MDRQLDIFIAGAQKAGSTSLFRYLAQHPEVMAHPQQEMTYFVNHEEYRQRWDKALERYFPAANSAPEKRLLAKHVMLMYSQQGMRRLASLNPGVRLIVLLRNPVDRAYSAYWYARRMGWERARSFEDALRRERAGAMRPNRRWFDDCYVGNGIYIEHLKNLWRTFSPNAVHVILDSELRQDPAIVCEKVFDFVHLDCSFRPDTHTQLNRAAAARSERLAALLARFLRSPAKGLIRRFIPDSMSFRLRYAVQRWNTRSFDMPPMNALTRTQLVELFAPWNAQLEQALGRQLEDWNRTS